MSIVTSHFVCPSVASISFSPPCRWPVAEIHNNLLKNDPSTDLARAFETYLIDNIISAWIWIWNCVLGKDLFNL